MKIEIFAPLTPCRVDHYTLPKILNTSPVPFRQQDSLVIHRVSMNIWNRSYITQPLPPVSIKKLSLRTARIGFFKRLDAILVVTFSLFL
ncbi:MAG TPA: hypothetical protein VI112_18295 [Bacteroidia bacterium]|jgi:hypothetical protein